MIPNRSSRSVRKNPKSLRKFVNEMVDEKIAKAWAK
jgi:hypothetical protein